MRVVIANHSLDAPAGSETYVMTLAQGLRTLRHDVICFSPHVGQVDARAFGWSPTPGRSAPSTSFTVATSTARTWPLRRCR
jgi:hypothetical protein